MPPAPRSLPDLPANYTPQFYITDVVTKLTDPTFKARVLRCWSDEEDLPLPELPPGQVHHELDRPLLRGEVGISVGLGHLSDLSIVPESTLVLFQREFNIGDIVKRSLSNVESAVVVGYDTEVQIEHAVDGRKVKGWVPWSQLRSDMAIEARYRVMYGEWVGIVEEIFEIAKVQHASGSGSYYVRASEGTLEVGRTALETFGPDEERGYRYPRGAKSSTDIVTEVYPELVFVEWNAINQELPISEQDQHPEPPKLWRGTDIQRLTSLDSFRYAPVQLGMICRFRDPNDGMCLSAPSWKPARSILGSSSTEKGLKAFRVTESRSNVRLRWQDGRETREWASGLVPYRNVDDYETWPGEHLVWRDDTGQRRPVCIQCFNPHQRTADVLFTDDQTRSTVSVLELDTGGPGKAEYGVGFGQQVLFTRDNEMPLPEVPTLGQTAPSPELDALKDEALGDIRFGWARDVTHFEPNIPGGNLDKFGWWGEVENLHLDGSVSVRLPNGTIRKAGIKQLILLNDPLGEEVGHNGMMGLDAMGDGDEWMDEDEDQDEDDIQILNGDVWETVGMGGTGVNGQSAGPIRITDIDLDAAGSEMDVEEMFPTETDDDGDTTMRDGEAEAGPSNPSASGLGLLGNQEWQSFDTLEGAPADHHFYSEPRVGAAKSYLARLQKEHRALMTSLPENILVRTYEDRSDLMRVLIIGPEGTPYRDAPFIFDVYLSPSKFPHDPPSVFFHSHTNGKGRCNPNLYEDGKVCLSILGTWAGDKSESWSPQNSSLLQVFVSISGLVLVRHPYHCEPAYAKLEGTSEGRVNSRLYSEKAFVLSRAFIRQALTHAPAGLEKELRYFYLKKGKLRTVIDHVKALMEKSSIEAGAAGSEKDGLTGMEEKEEEWSEDALGSLTVGAILTLKRTLGALEALAIAEEGKT